jgi:hypothetical protein
VTTVNTVFAETPSLTSITAVSGTHNESEGRATVRLDDGTGRHVDVDLISDAFANVSLIGTAVPAARDQYGPQAAFG